VPGNELLNSPTINPSTGNDSDQQNWIKSRRLRKFAENLKDVEAVSDIVKHQEEISELQEKLKAIQSSTTILHDQIQQLKEDNSLVSTENEKLRREINDTRQSKQTLLKELSEKTTENIQLQEKNEQWKEDVQRLTNQLNNLIKEKEKIIQEKNAAVRVQQELTEQMNNLKVTIQTKEDQVKQALHINEQLQKSLEQNDFSHQRSKSELEQHILLLKQEYFFAMALSVKLTLFNQDIFSNKTIHSMWEIVVEERITFADWKKTVTRWFLADN